MNHTEAVVLCPECRKTGKKSFVYPGIGSQTLVYYEPFYDEDGRHHIHDGNVTTASYRCSNGHQWSEQLTGSCWCGWPNKEADK